MIDETLPDGWVWTTLGEISTRPQYGWTTKAKPTGGTVLLLRTTDISHGTIDWDSVPYCTEVPEKLSDYLLASGDIVISRAGSVGFSYLLENIPKQTVFASYLIRFHPLIGCEPRYIAYYLQTPDYWRRIYDESSGIALANVNARKMETIDILLAPFPEQRRIVAAIEQQFTRLDNAVASLRSAQAKAKQYRASLLKAAVEGELTKDWRTEHPAEETGEQLLTRVLAERRARWEEAELAKMRERGITPRDSKWEERYEEPKGPDVERLPELPEGWCWANLGQITRFQNGRPFPSKEYTTSGIKLLRPGNMYADGTIKWTDANTRYLSETWAEHNPDLILFGHELVINLTAQSLKDEFLGRVCITGEGDKALLNQRLARITPLSDINRYYILFMLKSSVFRQFVDSLNTGSLIQHMFTSQLDNFSFPLPPLIEQAQIVAEIEAELSNIAKLQEVTENSLKRAEHERQSILQEAFAGRLVPQDPDNEPASVLLERIREERKRREEQEKVVSVDRKGGHMVDRKRRRGRKAGGEQQGGRLYETLVEAGQPLSPDELFKRVGLSADEQSESAETFYEELQDDEAEKLIKEHKTDDLVLLEALPSEQEELAEAAEVEQSGRKEQDGKKVEKPTLWDMNDL